MAKGSATKTAPTLGDAERYRQFLESAASEHKVWGLWRDGWALAKDEEGGLVFPLWPAEEAAKMGAVGPWKGFTPEEIPVEDLLDQLLPQLARDKVSPSVYPVPGTKSEPAPSIAKLISDLEGVLGDEEDDAD
jgi:hypothetical protein